MHSSQSSNASRPFWGTIFVLIGLLYLLKTFNIINLNVSHIIFSFPFIILVIGIILVINSRNTIFGIIIAVIGALFLIPRIYPNVDVDGDIIVPVIIIGLGIYILFNRRSHIHHFEINSGKKVGQDYIDDVSIFGGGHKTIFSDNFSGGNITAIFGGSEIDLTQCKLAEGNVIIDVIMIFGGSTIIVPRDWNVRVNITPVFGGFSNKIFRSPNTPIDSTRTLIIRGVALFGGGEIKYY
jgi:predicted membrane protein